MKDAAIGQPDQIRQALKIIEKYSLELVEE